MGNFSGIGKFPEGFRSLIKKRLTMGKPEDLFPFVECMTKQSSGSRIRFPSTCGKHHKRTITGIFFVHTVKGADRIQLVMIRMTGIAPRNWTHFSGCRKFDVFALHVSLFLLRRLYLFKRLPSTLIRLRVVDILEQGLLAQAAAFARALFGGDAVLTAHET